MFKKIIKPLASILILTTVLVFVDFSNFTKVLVEVQLGYIVLVVLGYLLGQIISSIKWWLLARSGGIVTAYPNVLKSYFSGAFVNCFGLGLVGGDLARSLYLSELSGAPKASSFASVVADRIHGLSVLLVIGVSFALTLNGFSDRLLVQLLIPLLVSLLGLWFFGPKLFIKFFPKNNKFYQKLTPAVQFFPNRGWYLLGITILSVGFHFLQISLHFLMAAALGISLPLTVIFASIPFVNIVTSLPFSWNGLGVREAAYIFFLVPKYLSHEQAIAFGAIWFFAVTLNSLFGSFAITSASEWKIFKQIKNLDNAGK